MPALFIHLRTFKGRDMAILVDSITSMHVDAEGDTRVDFGEDDFLYTSEPLPDLVRRLNALASGDLSAATLPDA